MPQSESSGFPRKQEMKDEWDQAVKEESEEAGKFQKTTRKKKKKKEDHEEGN